MEERREEELEGWEERERKVLTGLCFDGTCCW